MARKTSTSKKSPTSKAKTTSARSKSAARKRTSTTSKTTQQKTSTSRKSAPAPTGGAESVRTGISLDRKLDIAGIGLALFGVLTILSLLSPINSSVTGWWVTLLGLGFGVGKYMIPILMLGFGLWLVLRNFERIPELAVERVLGYIMLFVWFLAVVHFSIVNFTETGQSALEIAAEGKGGGYLGAGVIVLLDSVLGVGGAAIALVALLVIALALALDVTVLEMTRWMNGLYNRIQDWLIETSAAWRARRKAKTGGVGYSPQVPPLSAERMSASGEFSPAPAPIPALSMGAEETQRAWVLPPVAQILDSGSDVDYDDEIDLERARVIEETLASFGAPARVIEINRGPTITQFGVEPDFIETRSGRTRVRVGKIATLADDLALVLSARTIRVQAPVPGKGFVGIEVPNEQVSLVALRDLIESDAFKRLKTPLRFALGQNVAGNAVAADLAGMPHLLIAGTTGSGKSVCVNSLICCLLLHNSPDDLRMVMVDPKRVELTGYNGIPHLLAPVVVELERVVAALQWVMREMDMRYHKLAEVGTRNIQEYNARQQVQGGKKLPYLVVVIDELADLMMLAPDETERSITRLAQLARATGIHLVIATQRPSVDVVTGLIKANFPSRIAFAVASGVDSRVILDQPGAERLLGRGDMLFQAPDAPAPVRLQGVFVSDLEIQRLVNYWRGFAGPQVAATAAGGVPDALPPGVPLKQMGFWEEVEAEENLDPLFNDAVDLVRRQGRASISMLQRRLRIGYTRAARLVETMEDRGIVGPPDPGTGAREVLDYGPAAPPVDE